MFLPDTRNYFYLNCIKTKFKDIYDIHKGNISNNISEGKKDLNSLKQIVSNKATIFYKIKFKEENKCREKNEYGKILLTISYT